MPLPSDTSSAAENSSHTGLYCPADIDEASDKLGANCGPGALAAILERPVLDVMELMGPDWPGYTNGKTMIEALRRWGGPFVPHHRWPTRGLCWIQFTGPWCNPGVPFGARLSRSHWVAVDCDGEFVFDINAYRWLPKADWETAIIPMLREAYKKSTGWEVRQGIEVRKPVTVAG